MANEDEKCEKCAFWRNPHRWIDEYMVTWCDGECHRNPPSTNGHLSYFPRTQSGNWCGEFKRTAPIDALGEKIAKMDAIAERIEK